MEIHLKTLTPLWSGGVEGTCDRLHETGILGSLRWWYEAIVRGLGGSACDPTSDDRCIYEHGKGLTSVCHVCQIFGCTSLSRSFRIEFEGFEKASLSFMTTLSRQVQGKRWPNNAWWLKKSFEKPGHPIEDQVVLFANGKRDAKLKLIATRPLPGEVNWEAQMKFLLKWIEDHAGLGRKIQNGFGQIRTDIGGSIAQKGETALKEFVKRPAKDQQKTKAAFPFASRFFKLEFRVHKEDPQVQWVLGNGQWVGRQDRSLCPSRFIPCAYDMRYTMRLQGADRLSGLRWGLKQARHKEFVEELFGKMGYGSHVNVSHLIAEDDHYRLRVFGFVNEKDRDFILRHIRETIKEIFSTSKELE